MTFSLTGYDSIPTDGSGRVLITDINPTGDNNEDALICRSEIDTFTTIVGLGTNWFLDPTGMSTDEGDRIPSPEPRGWNRNRDLDSGRRLVRLRRSSATAEEGVFTCTIAGDNNSPRSLGIYYRSEFFDVFQGRSVVRLALCKSQSLIIAKNSGLYHDLVPFFLIMVAEDVCVV